MGPQMTLADLSRPPLSSFDLCWTLSNLDPMWPHVMVYEKKPHIISCDLSQHRYLGQPHVTLVILMGPQQRFCDLGCPFVILIYRIWPQLNSYDLCWPHRTITSCDLSWPVTSFDQSWHEVNHLRLAKVTREKLMSKEGCIGPMSLAMVTGG